MKGNGNPEGEGGVKGGWVCVCVCVGEIGDVFLPSDFYKSHERFNITHRAKRFLAVTS